MSHKQYKKLKEKYESKVPFVWTHWISLRHSYDEALDFIKTTINDENKEVKPEYF